MFDWARTSLFLFPFCLSNCGFVRCVFSSDHHHHCCCCWCSKPLRNANWRPHQPGYGKVTTCGAGCVSARRDTRLIRTLVIAVMTSLIVSFLQLITGLSRLRFHLTSSPRLSVLHLQSEIVHRWCPSLMEMTLSGKVTLQLTFQPPVAPYYRAETTSAALTPPIRCTVL